MGVVEIVDVEGEGGTIQQWPAYVTTYEDMRLLVWMSVAVQDIYMYMT